MWNFAELCAHLMPLAENYFNDVDKIVFAREFQLDQWIAPALVKLCQREEPLNGEEASKIGLDTLLFISRIREERLKSANVVSSCCKYHLNSYCNSCGRSSCGITRIMADEVIDGKARAWINSGYAFSS
jgi:hypothetical protein